MKISINCKDIEGSYGGVIAFVRSLKKRLLKNNHLVTNTLKDGDIDVIVIASYSTWSTATFTYLDAWAYKLRHPKTVIVSRINECDERKNTTYMNRLLVNISRHADFIVFIASWLKPLMEKAGLPENKPSRVILNGADESIFNTQGKTFWNGIDRLKIVTHHWGGGFLKGHDIYQKLDALLEKKEYQDKFEFTFIGNYPDDLEYKNTKIIPSLSEHELADELKKHHIYLTASRNEPAGMHHIEGAMCGLPLLYINSGALPEYCKGFGVEFTPENFEEKLEEIRKNYSHWAEKMKDYDNTAEKMTDGYYTLIQKLHEDKEKYSLKKVSFFEKNILYHWLKIYSVIDSYFFRIKLFYENSINK